MPKPPRLSAVDAETLLFKAGFLWLRSKGSHRVYFKGGRRVVVPFHGTGTLHPKIVKQILDAIEEASIEPTSPAQ
jgi:predicted RNA binding protein YcfA (HicA-like mRNA interferase family)